MVAINEAEQPKSEHAKFSPFCLKRLLCFTEYWVAYCNLSTSATRRNYAITNRRFVRAYFSAQSGRLRPEQALAPYGAWRKRSNLSQARQNLAGSTPVKPLTLATLPVEALREVAEALAPSPYGARRPVQTVA